MRYNLKHPSVPPMPTAICDTRACAKVLMVFICIEQCVVARGVVVGCLKDLSHVAPVFVRAGVGGVVVEEETMH
jgi:hypothetical protein